VRITVVVPTFRRPELLVRCLAALAEQDLEQSDYEVLVVDDCSGDDTTDILATTEQKWPQLRWCTQPDNAGPAAARNRGVDAANGEIILFLDDDIVAAENLVRTHAELHEDHDYHFGVVGRVEWHPGLEVTPFMRWLDTTDLQFAFDTWMRDGPIDRPWEAFYTCNLSMSAEMLAEVGGFDERFPYPAFEDIELGVRLARKGFRLEYRPQALAWNARPITIEDFCRRMERVGESSTLLKRAQPDLPFELPPIDPTERIGLREIARWSLPFFAAVVPSERIRARNYRSKIGKAYRRGTGRAKVAEETSPGVGR
jgi:GT2 family glycosyltransferase